MCSLLPEDPHSELILPFSILPPLSKEVNSSRKRTCSPRSKFFPIRVDPVSEGLYDLWKPIGSQGSNCPPLVKSLKTMDMYTNTAFRVGCLKKANKNCIVHFRKRKKDKEFGISRGIDFQNVSNVVNFDFPTTVNAYIHRVGR